MIIFRVWKMYKSLIINNIQYDRNYNRNSVNIKLKVKYLNIQFLTIGLNEMES